jgi:hypothetical protein
MAAQTSVIADLGGYVNRAAKLLRLDATLLSIETKQNLTAIALALGLLLAALAFAFLGLTILLFAVVLILIQFGLSPALAALLVAAALFVAAGLMVLVGLQRLKGWSPMPRRTLIQFQANIEALRASFHHEPKPNH